MSQTIVAMFAGVARRRPDATAIVWRRSAWTFAQLAAAIDRVRSALAFRRLERGARVAILVRNSPHYAAIYYGILGSGCGAMPLNTQERAAVLARQIEHCGARLLIADREHPEYQALTAAVTGSNVEIVPVGVDDDAGEFDRFITELGDSGPTPPYLEPASGDLATVIYTSGTTGRPKGVMLSHGNLSANACAIISYLEMTAADRGLCVLPFHFSYGNSVLHSHLLAGATLVIEDNFAFPKLVVQRMQDDGITGFSGVPSTFALMLGRCDLSEFRLSALRYITQAGGAMPRPLIERVRAQAPRARLFIMYGQTEATARLTYLPPEKLEERLGSVGLALSGIEIKILDAAGRELPAGETGEICARGPSIMLGYWNDTAATSEALRGGWLHTGDLGHKDADGYLYIDGRAVDMIKVGAFRISPQEIEEVIAALPDVEEVAVTAIPDEILGHAVKAVVVPRAGGALDVRAVKAHCRQHLAVYKVPKIVEFAATLPRTSSGKIQRFKLA
jgi:long-chain acyl-CoA synthetase